MLVPHHSLNFNLVDETDDYIVVDKPPFLLIHPTKPNGAPTLWKELRELLAFEIASGGQVSIVNRLDRETSGLVLVAKTSPAARRFGLLMQRQQVKKEYLAIVWGWPEWERYFLDAPMDRQGKHQESAIWLKHMIHPSGAPAQTEFYGPDEQLYLRFVDAGWTLELEQRLLLPRHALHSAKLAIEGGREWASPLPPDLAEFCSGDR